MQIKIVLNHEEQKALIKALATNTTLDMGKFETFVSFFKIDIAIDVLVLGDEINLRLPIDHFNLTVKRSSPEFQAIKNYIYDHI